MRKDYNIPPVNKITPDLDIHQTDDGKWSVCVSGIELGIRNSFNECLELYESHMAENGYF